MKKLTLFLSILLSGLICNAQQTYKVTSSGTVFTPSVINAVSGDTVTFNLSSNHPVLQVSEATYNAGGSTPFQNGFSFSSGTGSVILTDAGTYYFICVNHIGSGMKGKITVTQATGLEIINPAGDFAVFPNPVSDKLYIKSPAGSEPEQIGIYDISGKLVFQPEEKEGENLGTTVFLPGLRKGMYVVRVTYPGKTYTRKFIKL